MDQRHTMVHHSLVTITFGLFRLIEEEAGKVKHNRDCWEVMHLSRGMVKRLEKDYLENLVDYKFDLNKAVMYIDDIKKFISTSSVQALESKLTQVQKRAAKLYPSVFNVLS